MESTVEIEHTLDINQLLGHIHSLWGNRLQLFKTSTTDGWHSA